ncbi:putative hydrolase [Thelonectria olida]|uniref:Hydrolase n=1 Tax=Thelonectria olida TaxID=1576542 RepID=A0A9P8WDK8_9HYPO|nr:putative hydrolase [Thelonectria olida]
MAYISTQISSVDAGGSTVFYRHASPFEPPKGTILLLHGFPSSSHQFRNLIPLLASHGYKVIAPDLPGYGFTTVPEGYSYTFANLTKTIEAFVQELELQKFAIYIFDYGAPVGLRFALNHPDKIAAIVSQNGNAYMEGFGEKFWAPIRKYWESGAKEDRDALQVALELDSIKWQYTNGSPHAAQVQPEAYHLDHALIQRPGNKDVQLDLLYDYRTNIDLYPSFQEYFRKSKVPVLAMWGKNDEIFVAPGAEAYKKDVEYLEFEFLDAGHFAIETNEKKVADNMKDFFDKFRVFG